MLGHSNAVIMTPHFVLPNIPNAWLGDISVLVHDAPEDLFQVRQATNIVRNVGGAVSAGEGVERQVGLVDILGNEVMHVQSHKFHQVNSGYVYNSVRAADVNC